MESRTPIIPPGDSHRPAIRQLCVDLFERACEEASWFDALAMPGMAERARGRAIGIIEFRDGVIGEPDEPFQPESQGAL